MSSNFLSPRKKRKLQPTPPEPIDQAEAMQPPSMKPKKARKMNMGNEMRRKNRRINSPMV